MKTTLVILALLFLSSNAYASGEWVPHNHPYIMVQPQTQIICQNINQPVTPNISIIYQWTPHVVLEAVTTKTRRFFYEQEITTMVPVTKWVYQPVIISNQ